MFSPLLGKVARFWLKYFKKMGGSKHQRKWWMSLSDAMKVIFCLHEIHRETGWKATPRILDELGLLSLINYLLITLDSYECWRVCFQPLLKSQWYRTLKCLSFNWAVPIVMSKWAACICMMIFHTKWWANEQQGWGLSTNQFIGTLCWSLLGPIMMT